MKLNVDHKIVCDIDETIIDSIVDAFTEDDWHVSDYRNKAGGMSKTNTIPIMHTPLCRTGQCDMEPIKQLRKELLYDKYFPLVEPVLDKLREHYQFRQYAIFIARLSPKSSINPHADSGNFLELCNRIHVPLVTNPEVKYMIDKNFYYWQRGKIYEFDNTRLHGVYNNSDEYRIHLVINLYNLSDEQLI
jgi:hypothetical protein